MGQPQRSVFIITLITLILSTATLAQDRVTNRGVLKRTTTMASAGVAITTLSDMMGARTLFNEDRAKSARKDLIKATRAIPSVFRRPHTDPHSQARPEIWTLWDDFRARAKTARQAAWALDTDSLADLRKSLPKLVVACHNCHQYYRYLPR